MWKVICRVALLITSRSRNQNAVGGKGALPSTGPHLNAKDVSPLYPLPQPFFFSYFFTPSLLSNVLTSSFVLYGLIFSLSFPHLLLLLS